jgi:hypothetical protein
MLFQANMPKSFWAEAMTTAAYLINRLPSDAINGNISYELWHDKLLMSRDLQSLKPSVASFITMCLKYVVKLPIN